MVSTCERLGTCRYREQAKDAEKLEPKGTVAGRRYVLASLVDTKRHRPARADLTHICYVHGTRKTRISPKRESSSQEKPLEMRVEERGKSACHPVMGWIGIATSSHAKAGRLPQGLS